MKKFKKKKFIFFVSVLPFFNLFFAPEIGTLV